MQNQESRVPNRKRLLVDPPFQAIFALYAVMTTLLVIPVFVWISFYFYNLFFEKAQLMGLPADHELLQFVERQHTLKVLVFAIATVLIVIVNLIVSYFVSNRIAGSLYRLKVVMNQTTTIANAKQIHLRKMDFFRELNTAYNQLIERLKS